MLQWSTFATQVLSMKRLHCLLPPKCSLFGLLSKSDATRCSTPVLHVSSPSRRWMRALTSSARCRAVWTCCSWECSASCDLAQRQCWPTAPRLWICRILSKTLFAALGVSLAPCCGGYRISNPASCARQAGFDSPKQIAEHIHGEQFACDFISAPIFLDAAGRWPIACNSKWW